MPKTKISEFSATPANNTDIDSINISEGCAPSGINDAIRELMAQLKDFQTGAVGDSFNGPVGTTTAAAGAFTTLSASGAVTLSGGTANGVAYLNGSKVVTSGSALTFDGANVLTLFRTTATEALEPTIKFSNLTFAGQNPGVVKSSNGGLALDIQSPSDSTFQLRSRIYMNGGSGDSISFQASSNNGSTYGERMVLTSTGLGIGTSSPAQTLHVKTSTAATPITLGVLSNSTTLPALSFNGAYASTTMAGTYSLSGSLYTTVPSGAAQYFSIADSIKATLDSSGNLGLGVTPSAWSLGRVLELGSVNGNALWGIGVNACTLLSNAYFNSGYVYANNGFANRYDNGGASGVHAWYTAPSGTAGNAITFTQAMTLDASGRLGIGTTSPSEKLHLEGSGSQYMRVKTTTTNADMYFGITSSSVGYVGTGGSDPLAFYTGGTERARIDSSGNFRVGVGTSTTNTYMDVNHATGSSSGASFFVARYNGTQIGDIAQSGTTAVAYNTSSDYRLKNTIAPMTGALAKVAQLKPCTYKWNADCSDGEGFIAHELAEVCPHAVTGEKDAVDEEGNPKYQGIDTSFLVATLTAAIQEQQAIIESLKARLDAANL